jgi:hypothetical protein
MVMRKSKRRYTKEPGKVLVDFRKSTRREETRVVEVRRKAQVA